MKNMTGHVENGMINIEFETENQDMITLKGYNQGGFFKVDEGYIHELTTEQERELTKKELEELKYNTAVNAYAEELENH